MLVKAIERVAERYRPKVIVGASGVNYYGPHGPGEALDEPAAPSRDYMALLAQRWEEAWFRRARSACASNTRASGSCWPLEALPSKKWP